MFLPLNKQTTWAVERIQTQTQIRGFWLRVILFKARFNKINNSLLDIYLYLELLTTKVEDKDFVNLEIIYFFRVGNTQVAGRY